MARSMLLSCCAGIAFVAGSHAACAGAVTTTKTPIGVPAVQGGGTIKPLYGNIHAFYGNIHAFSADMTPLFGSQSPFWGDAASFWGKTSPFAQPSDAASRTFWGKTDPFWGSGANNPYPATTLLGLPLPLPGGKVSYARIGTFWKTEGLAWTSVESNWAKASTSADFTRVAAQIKTAILDPANTFWGTTVAAGKANTTGPVGPLLPGLNILKPKNANALLTNLLGQSGVKLRADGTIDPTSLAGLDATQRASLFLNLYDGLMDYAGTGHVDWWMKTVGWSPALAQTAGTTPDGGSKPTVGMLDFVISQGKHTSKQITQYGSSAYSDGHGAAVGSLIMGSVDGSGVMGVMPANAVNVIAYDPYDSTNSTNWAAVGVGVATLANQIFKGKDVPMGVLNASMGVAGWTLNPGWNDALALAGAHGRVLVIAAGNDGSTQAQNVAWNFAANPTLLVVGSIGVDGTISSFSNRPGEACLVAPTTGTCKETDKLKYHFLVAPGEMVLVSDGQGGHVRQSGTSLAAPLVSGAVALLQNRWPWLSNYSDETASIILKSATKVGTNPGADAVYGAGILNIAASQSPLDWSAMSYYQVRNGKAATAATRLSTVVNQIAGGTQASWNAANLSYTAIEPIGRTYRDFQIPLSSKLVGQKTATRGGKQLYQSYLFNALRSQGNAFVQAGDGGLVDAANADADAGELPGSRAFAPGGDATKVAGMALRISMAPVDQRAGFALSNTPYQTAATLTGDGVAIRLGYGSGAAALADGGAVRFASDYDLDRGGANPLLGLASGGGYVGGAGRLGSGFSWTAGFTQRSERRDIDAFGLAYLGEGANRYSAAAAQVGVAYQAAPALTLTGSVTRLHEASALLGTQSVDASDLAGGATSTGATIGFDMRLVGSITLSGTGTVASTRAAGGQLTTGSGLLSTAAELAVMKAGVFGGNDHLRLALSRPLAVSGGSLHYSSVAVIDRDTGALGVVDQRVSGSQRARYAAELLYGRSFAGGRSTLSLFGRGVTREIADESSGPGYDVGARFQFGF